MKAKINPINLILEVYPSRAGGTQAFPDFLLPYFFFFFFVASVKLNMLNSI